MNDAARNDDLNWTAFLYISDELSAEERAAFETRLADDQAARDAVCRAVQMTGAVHSVLESEEKSLTPSPSPSGGGEQRPLRGVPHFAVRALVAAACIVVAAFALRSWLAPTDSVRTDLPSGDRVAESDDVESVAGQLVSLWTSASAPQGASAEASTGATNSADSAVQTDVDIVIGRGDELEVPDWLFAAVAKELADEDVFGSESDDAAEMN
jgi:hypothetical protein